MIAADLVATIQILTAEIQAVENRFPNFQAAANGALRTLNAAQRSDAKRIVVPQAPLPTRVAIMGKFLFSDLG
jgi:hypothetical protein